MWLTFKKRDLRNEKHLKIKKNYKKISNENSKKLLKQLKNQRKSSNKV